MSFRPCALIPVYNHHAALPRLVTALRAQGLPVLLVDDGSDAVTKAALAALAQAGVEVLTQARNGGKGAAVLAGLALAAEQGYSHALQIDADGQHEVADAGAMLALAEQHPDELISGTPRYDGSVPKVRFYGRYLTHSLVWASTLSLSLRDSMCGFRVYPIAPTLALAGRVNIGSRMDFDTEIMVRLYWAGTPSRFLPTRVRYPEDGISHYRMLRDNARMTWLHVRLIAGMLPRAPMLLHRAHVRRRSAHWARIGERGSLAGLRFLGTLDRLLPRFVSQAVLYPVTAYFFATHPRARQASRRFLAAAGQPATLGLSFRHFMSFSLNILDKVAAWHDPERMERKVDFPPDARRLFVDTLAQGRGLLLLSSHLGNLELARAMATLIPGVKVNALVYAQNSRKLNAMLRETSDKYGLRLIFVQEIGADTAVLLHEKVAAGEVVVIVGDRVPVPPDSSSIERASGSTVRAPFLGTSAPFAVGPYVLAHVLECPVLLFFCMRERLKDGAWGYRLYLEPFADRIHLPRKGRAETAAAWAGRYAERLAAYAARFPLQWYNFYDFWGEGDAQAVPPASPQGK
jgi:predicted LPLAT superfamily acyltransferase